MQNPIVPESAMRAAQHQISQFAAPFKKSHSVDLENSDYGPAFMRHLFFLHHPSVGSVLGIAVDDERKFYNAYYWFRRFARLHSKKHGYDAGIEQQAFKMLDDADFDIDFETIDMLDDKAKADSENVG